MERENKAISQLPIVPRVFIQLPSTYPPTPLGPQLRLEPDNWCSHQDSEVCPQPPVILGWLCGCAARMGSSGNMGSSGRVPCEHREGAETPGSAQHREGACLCQQSQMGVFDCTMVSACPVPAGRSTGKGPSDASQAPGGPDTQFGIRIGNCHK